ncbi:Prolamin-like domain [Senna tora]|uniref:Prolamin-like domain n=1 Tax=Senna tora TaxID=362788 RepID=A0A834WEI5_9FABA|nr:Prolamin-like domain [Senna tora]
MVLLYFTSTATTTATTTTTTADIGISKRSHDHRQFWMGHELPAEPAKGYYKHLGECINVLTAKCGEQMFDYIFYKRVELSYICCHKVVKMGSKCNKDLAHTLASMKDFGMWKNQINNRALQMYHQCGYIDRCVAKG